MCRDEGTVCWRTWCFHHTSPMSLPGHNWMQRKGSFCRFRRGLQASKEPLDDGSSQCLPNSVMTQGSCGTFGRGLLRTSPAAGLHEVRVQNSLDCVRQLLGQRHRTMGSLCLGVRAVSLYSFSRHWSTGSNHSRCWYRSKTDRILPVWSL